MQWRQTLWGEYIISRIQKAKCILLEIGFFVGSEKETDSIIESRSRAINILIMNILNDEMEMSKKDSVFFRTGLIFSKVLKLLSLKIDTLVSEIESF